MRLAILYVIGAYVKRYGGGVHCMSAKCAVLYVSVVIFARCVKMVQRC